MPRILMLEDVEKAAKGFGLPLEPGQDVEAYRIQWKGGEAVSLTPPERVGADGGGPERVRYLRLQADGRLAADSLPMAAIEAIETPVPGRNAAEIPFGALANCILPFALAGTNPLPMLLSLGAWGIPMSHTPEFRRLPAGEYFQPPPGWTGALSVTAGAVPRSAFNPEDPRREPVSGFRIGVQTGPRRSAAAFEFGLRALRLGSPISRDPEILSDAESYEYDVTRRDNLYAKTGTGLLLSPLLYLTWWESPRATVFTRSGFYWSLNGINGINGIEGIDGSEAGTGPEIGAGFDLWLSRSLALRGECDVLMPVRSDWDVSLEPALGLGIAYRLNPRPSPSRQLPVLISALQSIPASRPAPIVLLEAALSPFQRLGLGAHYYASPLMQSTYTNSYSTNYNAERQDQLSLLAAYALHTSDSGRLQVGIQIMTGLMSTHSATAYSYRTDIGGSQSSGWQRDYNLAFYLAPEAGFRLGAGFGLRAQLHLVSIEPAFGHPGNVAGAAGLTYSLPGAGERR